MLRRVVPFGVLELLLWPSLVVDCFVFSVVAVGLVFWAIHLWLDKVVASLVFVLIWS